jgi:hypothetical protein
LCKLREGVFVVSAKKDFDFYVWLVEIEPPLKSATGLGEFMDWAEALRGLTVHP